jgi:RNA polymerase sigma-70 factor (ECF subfamily)
VRGGRRLFREGLDEGTSEVGEEQAAAFVAAGSLPPRERLRARLEELWAEVQGAEQSALLALLEDSTRDAEALRDALSTQLMELFRLHGSRTAFGLLFELNREHVLAQVAARLRRYASKADPHDVLQEVFVNIYRYPHRFDCARDDAFRVWTATIVRNTVLKHLRSLSRNGRAEVAFEDVPEPSDPGEVGEPLQGVIETESRQECSRVFLTYLHLYLRFYTMLSEREQKAIRLVEVDGLSYRSAASELGIRLENLKMVIFRARRKIHRSMRRVFEGLPPDVKPARDPRPATRLGAACDQGRVETDPEALEEEDVLS